MPDPLPPPEEAPAPPPPTFQWLDPLYHLETLVPLRPELDGWLHYSAFLVRCLSAAGLASDLHSPVLRFLHPGAFCHAFVPVVHPVPPFPLLRHDGSSDASSLAYTQSSFGGRGFLRPADDPTPPRCRGLDAALGCDGALTLLCQLRVGDLPLVMRGGLCPAWVCDDDALQCFVCLRCHLEEASHPVYGLCRWVHSASAQPHDPSAGLVRDVALDGTDLYSQLRSADVQPTFTAEEQAKGGKTERGYEFPRMRLSHWVCVPTRPSKEAQAAALGAEHGELSTALSGERAQWRRQHSTPFFVRLGGYEVHRHALVEQRCPHVGARGERCGVAMHLLLTFPSGRLLPMRWHGGLDLWLYQCSAHRDVFSLVAVN